MQSSPWHSCSHLEAQPFRPRAQGCPCFLFSPTVGSPPQCGVHVCPPSSTVTLGCSHCLLMPGSLQEIPHCLPCPVFNHFLLKNQRVLKTVNQHHITPSLKSPRTFLRIKFKLFKLRFLQMLLTLYPLHSLCQGRSPTLLGWFLLVLLVSAPTSLPWRGALCPLGLRSSFPSCDITDLLACFLPCLLSAQPWLHKGRDHIHCAYCCVLDIWAGLGEEWTLNKHLWMSDRVEWIHALMKHILSQGTQSHTWTLSHTCKHMHSSTPGSHIQMFPAASYSEARGGFCTCKLGHCRPLLAQSGKWSQVHGAH